MGQPEGNHVRPAPNTLRRQTVEVAREGARERGWDEDDDCDSARFVYSSTTEAAEAAEANDDEGRIAAAVTHFQIECQMQLAWRPNIASSLSFLA